MDLRDECSGYPAVLLSAKRQSSLSIRLTLAILLLPCMALGQAAAPAARQCNLKTDGKPIASLSDGDALITQSQAAALLEEMRRLELLLSARGAAPAASNAATNTRATGPAGPVTLELRPAEHALGDPTAPIVIVEFADLQCPFCKDFQDATFPALDNAYIKTGKVRFVVRDFPLPSHAYALPAAEAVRCAGQQGRYWDLRNALLTESSPPTEETIAAAAAKVHLEMKGFGECRTEHRFGPQIEAEQNEAEQLGVRGTPTFVIGRALRGRIQGVVISGNRSIDVYRHEIERILKEGAGQEGSNLPGAGTTSFAAKTN